MTIGRRSSTIVSIAAGVAVLIASCDTSRPVPAIPGDTSFATFESRARAGERLNVVFFGASLTWGANASDQNHTSYRARVADKLEEEYPDAHFKFFDAGLGGTGSQLGVFRLGRDVLQREPDLVFLDFSANDDIGTAEAETLASYEALVRRTVTEAKCPLIMMLFPFRWNVQEADLQEMKGRTAHLAIADAYSLPVGDAISLCIDRVRSGATTVEKIWPHDGVHPGDFGYSLFAEAAWSALRKGIERNLVCRAPDEMLHADTYMTSARVRVSSLGALPAGWRVGEPTLTSAWFDARMSRWLDDEVIAANRRKVVGEDGKESEAPQAVTPLKVHFRGTMLLLFGEKTNSSARYRIHIDGKQVCERDASSKRFGGSTHLSKVVVADLEAGVDHVLEIEPLFGTDKAQELRLESVCVAGPGARVWAAGMVEQDGVEWTGTSQHVPAKGVIIMRALILALAVLITSRGALAGAEMTMKKYLFSVLAVMLFFSQVPANVVREASAATPKALLESAPARIEECRKGDVRLALLDQDRRPLAGATVRVRQVRHEFLFGGSVFPLVYELQRGNLKLPFKEGEPLQLFSERYAELFNFATLPYYWWGYEKERGKPVHKSRERIAAWCKERNITTKGHPLVWNYRQLPWLPDDLAEVEKLQLAHVVNCVARFRGKVDVWDVVNETTNFAQGPNRARAPTMTAMWEKVGRIELPRRAFLAARKANPNATLLINDFHVGDDFADVVRGVVDENGKPLYDVIGLQSHMHGGNWSNTKLWNVCERFAAFRKPVHFTELTILSGKKGWHRPKPWPSTPKGEAEQAREVKRVYTLLFSHPAVEAIIWWNLSDAHAWMQAPAGLIGKDMSPKPVYNVLRKLIKEEWWTETSLTTDANGKATFRGFYGEYELMITAPDRSRKRIRNLEIERSPRQKTTDWMVHCSSETRR